MAARGAFDLGCKIVAIEALYLKLGGRAAARKSPSISARPKAISWISRKTIIAVSSNCSISSATRRQPIRRVRFRNSRSATMLMIILPGSRNGRWAASRRAAAIMASFEIPAGNTGQAAPGVKSKPVGLGFGQCRIGQDACAREPCHPAAPARRRALKNPLPDLHQGGGGEHGGARLR